jgi:hypothetical protein
MTNTILVDHQLGSAYKVVRYVADNLETIKALSESVAEVTTIYDAMGQVVALGNIVPQLNALYAGLGIFTQINTDINVIKAVGASLTQLTNIGVHLNQLLDFEGDAEAIISAAASVMTMEDRVEGLEAARDTAVAAVATIAQSLESANAAVVLADNAATNAATQVRIASDNAAAASGSADSALASKNSATTSATNATISANNAATSAANAAASAASFKRNRVLNPAMQICQEYGPDAAQTIGSGVNKTIIEGFVVTNVTDGTLIASWSTGPSGNPAPSGAKYRLGVGVSAADASLTSGQYAGLNWSLEGTQIADLRWGTASAQSIVVRFVVNLNIAGNYGFSILNSASNRSYVQTFTIAPGEVNTDKLITFLVPGDTTGTWLTEGGIGLTCRIALASGSFYLTASTGWQAGNFTGITGSQINSIATTSGGGSLCDVGVYAGSVAPLFEVPNIIDEQRRCHRYFEIVNAGFYGYTGGGYNLGAYTSFIAKRTSPVITIISTSNISNINSSIINVDEVSFNGCRVYGTGGIAGSSNWFGTLSVNARL